MFGTGLTDIDGVVAATSFPLPTELAGVSVWVNGTPAPILAVANVAGQQQINFQMPLTYPYGTHLGTCPCPGILVHGPHGYGFVLNWGAGQWGDSLLHSAAIFGAFPGGTPAIVHGADYSLITGSSPAHVGEVIVIYATGLGGGIPAVPVGNAAPLSPLSQGYTPIVLIGGVAAHVEFSGLAPGLAGVNQLNVVVPQVPPGQQTVAIQYVANAGGLGLPATIPVQ
jgi:hypothetical protein